MRLATPLLLATVLTLSAHAQTPGACELGRAERTLDVNDVSASLYNTGSLFYRDTGPLYFVPKLDGTSPFYAVGLWVGGYVGGELRMAAASYDNFSFWPGPLNPDGSLPNPDDCSAYDRIWSVTTFDLATYEATGEATADLAEWPVELGAEVVDGDGVPGNYDLAAGDRPRLYGTQTAFWVMNDVGNVHFETGTPPIGLEVRVHAFAVSSEEPALDQATFYRFTLLNRSALALDSARVGLFSDVDLGGAGDDYIGSDTTRGLAFVYNADNDDDDNSGSPGYGLNPPAAGFDLLDGLGSFTYFVGGGCNDQCDPTSGNGDQYFNYLSGLWKDGTPLYGGGDGYDDPQYPVTTFAFPGDPVPPAFWSERETHPDGPPNTPGDRRFIAGAASPTLQPGETTTFDVAALFARGADNFDSVTRLRAASDLVQAMHDDGSLFDTATPPVVYAAPTLLAPPDGAVVFDDGSFDLLLSWAAVPDAPGYRVDYSFTAPSGSGSGVLFTDSTVVRAPAVAPNEVVEVQWRVRADGMGLSGASSETRSYTYNRYVPAFAGEDDPTDSDQSPDEEVDGIVEVANPDATVCASPETSDDGCVWGGNAVWRDGNATADYYITGGAGIAGPAGGTLANVKANGFAAAGPPDDFELRFTGGEEYAVYFFGATATRNRIARVPFEVWNVRTTPGDPSDDVRMIAMLRSEATPQAAIADWTNQFPGHDRWSERAGTPLTESVYFVMPDRPDGYARFRADALAFGGAGALYDPAADGDQQEDLDPSTGAPCANQDYYAAFCYRGADTDTAPIARVSFADADSTGTTPPAGTVVRFVTAKPLLVGSEDEGPGGPAASAIGAAFPNPFGRRATVRYEVATAGVVRLSAYDVLGRRVAVLAEGERAAGAHEASLDGRGLAPGVYLLVLEAGDARAVRRLTHVR